MKKFKITTLLLLLMISIFSFLNVKEENSTIIDAQTDSERMLKAVWVTPFVGDVSLNGESVFKSNMTAVLNKMDDYGYNALIFHVRTHNNALYPSSLNPKSTDVSNINFNTFDPLEWIIDESHKRGIEFHAWLNPYRMGSRHVGSVPSVNPASNSSNILTSTEGERLLDPAKSAVKTFVADTVNEIITNYDVDAIHFDDYFYLPTPTSYGFNDQEKRDHVSDMVEGVYNKIQSYNANNNKHVQFGISPTGIYRNGTGNVYYSGGKVISNGSAGTTGQTHYSHYLFSDTLHWMNEGWLDYIMPQIYWARTNSAAPYKTVLDWWNEVCSHLDVNLYVGLGLYRSDEVWGNDKYELSAQMTLIENSSDAQGYAMFSYKHFKQVGTSSAFGTQMNNAFSIKPKRKKMSVLPVIKSMNPIVPNGVTSNHVNGTLNWTSSSDAKFYYLYRSTGTVTYSDDEIFKVVGKDIHTYNTEDTYNSYNYGVKVLSPTNHLSGQSIDEPIDTYTINYVLNGGSLVASYTNRDEMLKDFFTDVHSYLNPGMSYNDFVHGSGRTSGYDGVYDNTEYFNNLYELKNKNVNPNSIKFINQQQYNKWVPLLDLIDEYIKAVNPAQNLWDSHYNGSARIKHFMQKYTYNKQAAVGLVNKIPDELTQEVVYSYTKETPDITLPTVTKQGQDFLGWYDNYYYSGSPITKITRGSTGNKTFYAKWQGDEPVVTKYTVKFNLGYNNLTLPSVQVEEGNKVSKPANPSRSGYTFLGWLYGTSSFSFSTPINQDITLTANWRINDAPVEKITVTFDHGYNNIKHYVEVEEGHNVSRPANPSRSGYNFLGWYVANDIYGFNTPVTFPITLRARWQEINDPVDTLTVTFDYDYNNYKEQVQVERDEKVTKPPNPTRSGYTFLGWYMLNDLYNFNDPVSWSMTLKAKWKEIENGQDYVTVTFDHNYNDIRFTADVIRDNPVKKPNDPVREGYSFKGWYFVHNLHNFSDPISYNLTLIARWEKTPEVIHKVTITFIYGYDDLQEKVQVVRDERLINPPQPNRPGYEFLGWYLSNELYDFSKKIAYSTTLLAKWKKIEIPEDYIFVTFDYNYDNRKETSQVIRGNSVSEPVVPKRADYSFKGWYFINELYTFDEPVEYDITLIAQWEKVTSYTITFNYNNDLPNAKKMVIPGEKLERPLTPYKNGYLFNGWYLNNTKYNFSEKITKNLVLDANWKTIAQLENVSIYDKTYLRRAKKGVSEGLRYYAIIDNKYLNNEHGFYLIYGTASKTELINAIASDSTINNKSVLKVKVRSSLSNGIYSVVLTGIPQNYHDGLITVAPYVVDNSGSLIIANEFKISSVNHTKNQLKTSHISIEKFVVTITELEKRKNFKEI